MDRSCRPTTAQARSAPARMWHGPARLGLFVPKPSRHADCQGCELPDLGVTARQRPRTSAAGERGDRYSLGYSIAQDCVAWFRCLIDCPNSRALPLLAAPRTSTMPCLYFQRK